MIQQPATGRMVPQRPDEWAEYMVRIGLHRPGYSYLSDFSQVVLLFLVLCI